MAKICLWLYMFMAKIRLRGVVWKKLYPATLYEQNIVNIMMENDMGLEFATLR